MAGSDPAGSVTTWLTRLRASGRVGGHLGHAVEGIVGVGEAGVGIGGAGQTAAGSNSTALRGRMMSAISLFLTTRSFEPFQLLKRIKGLRQGYMKVQAVVFGELF